MTTRLFLAALLLLAGCSRSDREVVRPWEAAAGVELRAVQIGGTTRKAITLHLGDGPRRIALGAVQPGLLRTFVARTAGEAGVALALIDASAAAGPLGTCELPARAPANDWSECRIAVPRTARKAEIELRAEGADVEVAVASPLLTRGDRTRHPPVFVILIDTLRADRLAVFDEAIPLGAQLARLARDAIVFEHARSASSWTRSSVATLLTGLLPQAHLVLGRSDVLSADLPFLPEILQRNGYATLAWSANPNILPLWGFGRGFDAFTDAGAWHWVKKKTDAADVLDRVSAAVEDEGDSPAFYYVHLMDPHSPYMPDAAALKWVQQQRLIRTTFPPGTKPPDAKTIWLYARYLGEIEDVDTKLGAFFDALRARHVYDRALILVVADHGEEFYDHGDLYHGRTLYEEMLHVPAILKLPGNERGGTRVAAPVSLEDLMPTMLHVLGVKPPPDLDGRVLLDGKSPEAPRPRRAIVATLRLDTHDLSAVVREGWKLVVDHGTRTEHLYDLRRDPHEQNDLAESQPQRAEGLRRVLDGVVASRDAGWHVRGCGGSAPGSIEFAINGIAEVHPLFFDKGDRVERIAGGTQVHMKLDKVIAKHEMMGRLLESRVPDRDEVTFAPADGGAIELSFAAGEVSYALGTEAKTREGRKLRLEATLGGVRVRPSVPVRCGAPAPGPAPAGPYLRIWYVPSPERPTAKVDAGVEERMRALGY